VVKKQHSETGKKDREALGWHRPVMLAVGGSDSCAGAGIQADLLTAHALGVRCLTAIACLTSQTDNAFFALMSVPAGHIRRQIQDMIAHYPVKMVKVGALGTAKTVKAVAESLAGKSVPIVVDPVLGSSAAGSFSGQGLVDAYHEHLLNQTWLLTPNEAELARLGGLDAIFSAGTRYVLVTGGDTQQPVERLYSPQGMIKAFPHEKIPKTLHGTGCRFATAVTAYLMRGENMPNAIDKAIAFVQKEIRRQGVEDEKLLAAVADTKKDSSG